MKSIGLISVTQIVSSLMLVPFQVLAADTSDNTFTKGVKAAGIEPDRISSGYLAELAVGLVIVLVCIVVLGWLAKRFNRFQSAGDSSLQMLAGMSMGSRERVVLMQVGTTQILLGVSPGRINTLHVLENPIEISASKSVRQTGKDFAEKLNAAISKDKS